MTDRIFRRKGHSKPNMCKGTTVGPPGFPGHIGSGWVGGAGEAGPAERGCLAGLYQTPLAWLSQVRMG